MKTMLTDKMELGLVDYLYETSDIRRRLTLEYVAVDAETIGVSFRLSDGTRRHAEISLDKVLDHVRKTSWNIILIRDKRRFNTLP